MFFTKKKKITASIFAVLMTTGIFLPYAKAAYLTTTRDTKAPPESVTYDIQSFHDYELLYETDIMSYYYREDRDIIAIEDKRNGYTWKTGLDIAYGADVTEAIQEAKSLEDVLKLAEPLEAKMSSTYTAIANSLVTVEYYDAETLKSVSSSSREGAESQLVTLNNNPATRRLDINFYGLGLQVKVHVSFLEDSICYEIYDEDITGVGRSKIASINITPFLGASGGKQKLYDAEFEGYNEDPETFVDKYRIPGYILVPDGCGSLIRMNDNSASFAVYSGNVYGGDPAQNMYLYNNLTDAVPLKNPVMPVFGIAHGDRQAAFVAYAESAAEHMQIIARPEQNMTFYNWAYPRFVYNVNYFQVFNNKGEGYFTNMVEPNQMHVKMTYEFLSGDGSKDGYPADYIGMARKYRDYLISTNQLTKESSESVEIPLRLDFIMSEAKNGIVATEEVVMTRTEDVRDILTNAKENLGISNINSGLIGWQNKGESFSKPYKTSTSSKVGTKNEFKNLITDMRDLGMDVSYSRDYATINRLMMNFNGVAARHVNTWYVELNKDSILPESVPEKRFGYAIPKKSAEWLLEHFDYMKKHTESMTITGISNLLISTYSRNGISTTASEAITMYQDALEKVSGSLKVNLENPNQYLWKYTDRYLQCPVGTSQYLFETDTVPFLQLVLNGTMEVYAPYSNFSFYTQSDILRMIDYNLYPSFILSKQPSYLLSDTVSSHLYSTEYDQYEEIIKKIYKQVNDILREVKGYEWVDRTVLSDGVIKNTYQKGSELKYTIINYTEESYTYETNTIAALSAIVRN